MARPRKYSDKQIVHALREKKGMVYLAAKMIGCTAQAIYHRATKSKRVARVMEQEDGIVDDVAEMQLYKAICAGELSAIFYRLSTKGKKRGFTQKTEHEHSGSTVLEMVHEIVTTRADLTLPETDEQHHESNGKTHTNGQTNGQAPP